MPTSAAPSTPSASTAGETEPFTSALPTSASAAPAISVLRLHNRPPQVGDRFAIRTSVTEATALAPANVAEAKREPGQQVEAEVTCLALADGICNRHEIAVKRHTPRNANGPASVTLSGRYVVPGVGLPTEITQNGKKVGVAEELELHDVTSFVLRAALHPLLPDEVRVGDRLTKLASVLGPNVELTVTAIDGVAQSFTYRAKTSERSKDAGVVTELDIEDSVTVSASTRWPLTATSRSRLDSALKGERTTSLIERALLVTPLPQSPD